VNAEAARADLLRTAMVDALRAHGSIRTERVADAFGVVPRHLFAPEATLETAYDAHSAVVTKRDEHGISISSVSAPVIQAMMLEQAEIAPGMRVLEIGSGGYNAALIAELVGDQGEVTTVDIDPEVVARARESLEAAGYSRVNVVLADAEGGVSDHAPYNRVIVTVGAWDIPPAWVAQLTQSARLVVPLRLRGLTRSIAFERADGHLTSRGYELCGFVPMQGVGECREQLVLLHADDVGLRLDDGQQVDADRLRQALSQPRVEAWSGVRLGRGERFDGLHLWLALRLPNFCLLTAKKEAADAGIVAQVSPLGTPTIVEAGSFAYLVLRPVTAEQQLFEFGAIGHGPDADKLAQHMVTQIQSWDGTSLNARIEAYPVDTPDGRLPGGLVLAKKHTKVLISWPSAASA
jgi:protein-L-isoaspartate(D-aspartate) O-methyltransferase